MILMLPMRVLEAVDLLCQLYMEKELRSASAFFA
jgi:hypothetical protein